MATYGYDKNKDYQFLIDEAVKNNDYAQAAIYEQQRNEKIAGEGLNYEPTSKYANYLNGGAWGNSYSNPYQQQLDEAMARIGKDKFQYDADEDENYSAYRKQYLREAERTLRDTLGQYSAATGGIPSTQAVAAASQASDYYKSQLADKLPQMREQAFNEWMQKQNLNLNNANLLLSATQESKSGYYNQINAAMNRWAQMGYADDSVAAILGVPVGTPTSSQSYQNWQQAQTEQESQWQQAQAEQERQWQQGQQAKSDAYNMALMLINAGMMPSDEMLNTAGISKDDAQKLVDAAKAASIGGGYSGGGSYGGGSGSGGSSDGNGKIPKYSDAIWHDLEDAYINGNDGKLNYLLNTLWANGYDADDIMQILESSYQQEIPDLPSDGGTQKGGASGGHAKPSRENIFN